MPTMNLYYAIMRRHWKFLMELLIQKGQYLCNREIYTTIPIMQVMIKKRPMNAMKKLLIMEMHMECFKRDLC